MTEDTDLKVSEEFSDRIDTLRKMPSHTEEEKELRNEAFTEMRANFLLDNAKMMVGANSALMEDPKMTAPEMEKYLHDFFVVGSPEKVHEYVLELTKTKDKVLWTLDALKKTDPGQHSAWPVRLFTYLVNDPTLSLTEEQKLPHGRVKFGKRHPLAVAIEVESPDDYKRVKEEGERSAGFYGDSRLVWSPDGDGKYIPVIVTKGFGNPENWKHETGHAESQVIWTAAENMRKEDRIWEYSKTFKPKMELFKLEEFFKSEHTEEEFLELKKSKIWKYVISYAQAHAKNEILSETSHKFGTLEEHLRVLQDKDSLYDYFYRELDIPKDSRLHAELWSDYVAKLKSNTDNLVTLNTFYIEHSDWHKRRDLFRLVAAQIPVREWQEKFEKNGFIEEMNSYTAVKEGLRELGDGLIKIHNRPLTESERNVIQEVKSLKADLADTVSNGSDSFLLSELKMFSEKLAKLKVKAEETELYKTNKELIGYWKIYWQYANNLQPDSPEKGTLDRLKSDMEDEFEVPGNNAPETVIRYRQKLSEIMASKAEIPVDTL